MSRVSGPAPSVRTSTHRYPQEELDAMSQFYGGKRCIVRRLLEAPDWAHMLDAALLPSNERLQMMLNRNLRKDRHPQHAGEVRENIVPLYSGLHRSMDQVPPSCTLFPHEDILLRTFAYEQDLLEWRVAELEAGRPDPGRPSYDEVFGGARITQHRFHCSSTFGPFASLLDYNTPGSQYQLYHNMDCPGIDNPNCLTPFPVIDTLLSIPFSLLHNLPRLCGIFPSTQYQQQLITLGTEIIRLWSWDPTRDMIADSIAIRNRNSATGQQDDIPAAKPVPLHDPSRNYTSFNITIEVVPTPMFGTLIAPSSSHDFDQGKHTVECSLSPIMLGNVGIPSLPTQLAPVSDGLLLAVGDDELMKDDSRHVDGGIIAGITGSPVTSEAWTETDSENTGDGTAVKSENCQSFPDIRLWYQNVVNSEPEPGPLIPTPFKRGVIGSLSVNDVLMAKGLLHPLVFIQFINLDSFHNDALHM